MDRDTEELTALVIELGSLPPNLDREQLRADIADFLSDYGGQSIQDLNLSDALNEVVAIIRRHRIVLPPSVSLLIRMLVLLEGSARLLSRDFSLIELLTPNDKAGRLRRPLAWISVALAGLHMESFLPLPVRALRSATV